MRIARSTVWIIGVIAVVACVVTPITGRRVLILTSEAEENSLGEQAYQEILAKERGHLSQDRHTVEIVQRVGGRIAAVTDKPDYQWEFTVITSKEQNAFCLPGGKVAVYTGILPIAANEAGLATVLGHEVAHATARHAGQRITDSGLVQLGLTVLGSLIGGEDSTEKQLLMGALGLGVQFGHSLPFNRSQEAEADEIGLIYMAEAGYDPREAPKFWERFAAQKEGGSLPPFFSDHPSDESRMEALQKELPQAIEAYDRAPHKYGLGEKL